MDLTEENKAIIDGKSYRDLLAGWRYGKAGDPWFQGETGDYWGKRMKELRSTVDHVAISKEVDRGTYG